MHLLPAVDLEYYFCLCSFDFSCSENDGSKFDLDLERLYSSSQFVMKVIYKLLRRRDCTT
jgi:hypothetical protein